MADGMTITSAQGRRNSRSCAAAVIIAASLGCSRANRVEGKQGTMESKPMTLWQVISVVAAQMPLSKEEAGAITGGHLHARAAGRTAHLVGQQHHGRAQGSGPHHRCQLGTR